MGEVKWQYYLCTNICLIFRKWIRNYWDMEIHTKREFNAKWEYCAMSNDPLQMYLADPNNFRTIKATTGAAMGSLIALMLFVKAAWEDVSISNPNFDNLFAVAVCRERHNDQHLDQSYKIEIERILNNLQFVYLVGLGDVLEELVQAMQPRSCGQHLYLLR